MTLIAVGFGSNLGDRRAHLDAGLAWLAAHARPTARSSLYESAPIGPVVQGPFLNAVAVFETDESPKQVLSRLLEGELRQERVRDVPWGPRTLDLDLLLYGNRTVEQPGLKVPHPQLTVRRFVLEPLLEAWPDAALPDGSPLASFLGSVDDQDVKQIGDWAVPRWLAIRWWWQRRRRS